ncbi:hypothetical protein PVAND_006538 [Polypedilum vanderplanki]|uniref:SAM domain-containing protein n=1 Tax=Polypedilum vanderplanki TaxID=319348 RepID=A0A9J6C568_POLVA|nr:hypothetical protein PVAND_006538 [Polypedilum vanderplanki]
MSDRYHKAAKDGLCEVLKEATKKELNNKDSDGMTPVLWAAFEGKLDALRLMIGRGGDPNKTDQFGNSALHLSAAKGHFAVVDFLIKYGVNLYALDIDNHTAKELAAINNREDILRYLDGAAAHLEATDKKKVKDFKEKAKKQSEKRIKEFLKRQQKSEEQRQEAEKSNMLKAMKYKFWTGSHGNLSKMKESNLYSQDTRFSSLVGNGGTSVQVQRGAAQRKIQALKQVRQANANNNEMDQQNNNRSVRSIEGVKRIDSDVLYVGTFHSQNNDKRGRLAEVFDDTERRHATLSRFASQPDLLGNSELAEDIRNQRPSGLFDRPVLGALSMGHSIASDQLSNHSNHSSETSTSTKNPSSKKSSSSRQRQLVISSDEDESSSKNSSCDESDDPHEALKRFLAAYSLDEHFELLLRHQIDLETLMLLTDEDLKYLNLPLGPYRRLAVAIQERKNALNNPGAIFDSRL